MTATERIVNCLIESKEREEKGGGHQPPTRARGRERRRSRRRSEEKRKRSGRGRAAQPPVSKRSRKQRFLFFCWGLFFLGVLFLFFSPPRHPPPCVSRFCRDNSLVLFRPVGGHLCPPKSPLGDPSATFRQNRHNNLIPSLLQF